MIFRKVKREGFASAELSGKGETGLEFKADIHGSAENLGVKGSASFLGIILNIIGKVEFGVKEEDTKKTPKGAFKKQLIDRIDNFVKLEYNLKD